MGGKFIGKEMMGKEKGIINSSFKLWNISVIYIADISGKLLYNSDFFIFLLKNTFEIFEDFVLIM